MLISLTVTTGACSSGPEEKTQLDSLTSPAKLLDQGIHHYNNNNYAKSIHDFDKALLQYRSIDNQSGIAKSSLNLAKTYMAINNNQTAGAYLVRANEVIQQASLVELNEHLHLLQSSLAINNARYEQASDKLELALASKNTPIQLAALKNRTSIAFHKNDADKQQWLEKYRTLQQKHSENTASHLARIIRFDAESSHDDKEKTKLLARSLSISQKQAARTAIAATLSQWASVDIEQKRYREAEDKILRALFIRHQLGDVRNSLKLLQKLQTVYDRSADQKLSLVENWIKKLQAQELSGWDALFSAFDRYPQL